MDRLASYKVRRENILVGGRLYELLLPADPDALLDDPGVRARFERDEYMPYWATLWPGAILLADFIAGQWPAQQQPLAAPVSDPLLLHVSQFSSAVPGNEQSANGLPRPVTPPFLEGKLTAGSAEAGGSAPAAGRQAPLEGDGPILELGCGVGLVGLVAASRGYRVVLTDYDEDALRFAAENARLNGLTNVATRMIDWRRLYDDLRLERILAADVLYESRNLEPLARFIERHLMPGGMALVCDANRSTADPFGDVARRIGLEVRVQPVCGITGGTGLPISGRIYHVHKRDIS